MHIFMIYVSHFLILSSTNRYFNCLHTLVIVNTAALALDYRYLLWMLIFFLWLYTKKWDCTIIG